MEKFVLLGNDKAPPGWDGYWRTRTLVRLVILMALLVNAPWASAEIQITELSGQTPAHEPSAPQKPDQLPHSRIAHGEGEIATAWLASATDRYGHAVLGDALEAAALVIETRSGERVRLELPPSRVFEDLQPRIVDIDADGRDEILVVEADVELGASLAVYALQEGRLVRVSSTESLGRYRWLNPLGVGDFNGDGALDLALVTTPHIGGVLRLYHWAQPTLRQFASYPGVTTHVLGSTELALARVVTRKPRSRILLPEQGREAMLLLEWSETGFRTVDRMPLPAPIHSSLEPVGENQWRTRLEDGQMIVISAE